MKKLFYWMLDCCHLVKRSAVMYLFFAPPKHHLGHIVKNKNPVVIIPGILGRWSFMRPLVNALSLDGHPIYVVKNLKNNLINIPASAKIVGEFIKEHNLKNAILLTYSKGGLIARYLIEYHASKDKVVGVIAIATPFSGSSMAKLIPQKAFLELLPDSFIIKKLQSNKQYNNKIISIIPFYDNLIWAEKGSWLDGALQNIKVGVSGHHKILSDKEVLLIVKEAIEKFEVKS